MHTSAYARESEGDEGRWDLVVSTQGRMFREEALTAQVDMGLGVKFSRLLILKNRSPETSYDMTECFKCR